LKESLKKREYKEMYEMKYVSKRNKSKRILVFES
jgi:hypothetical protein